MHPTWKLTPEAYAARIDRTVELFRAINDRLHQDEAHGGFDPIVAALLTVAVQADMED